MNKINSLYVYSYKRNKNFNFFAFANSCTVWTTKWCSGMTLGKRNKKCNINKIINDIWFAPHKKIIRKKIKYWDEIPEEKYIYC